MTAISCEGCTHHGESRVYRTEGACYRSKTFTDGTSRKAAPVGFSILIETGSIHLIDNRLETDHCGPERRNYVARGGA